MSDWLAAGNGALNRYLGEAWVTDPSQAQAMNAEQMAEYQRRQGDPRNAPWPSNYEMRAMLNSLYERRKPTMTLAQWDERRAAFRALEGKK